MSTQELQDNYQQNKAIFKALLKMGRTGELLLLLEALAWLISKEVYPFTPDDLDRGMALVDTIKDNTRETIKGE